MPSLDVDPDEGAAPTASILEGTYNQTYLIRTADVAGGAGRRPVRPKHSGARLR